MSLLQHVLFLCLITFLTAVVTAAIRLRTPGRIVREATRFFVTVTVGIAILGGIVFVLEWIFIRPLL